MLGLCLYVPVPNSDPIEVEYFESNGLPSELKSLFKLSVFLPSQELSTYRKWRKVKVSFYYVFTFTLACTAFVFYTLALVYITVFVLYVQFRFQ